MTGRKKGCLLISNYEQFSLLKAQIKNNFQVYNPYDVQGTAYIIRQGKMNFIVVQVDGQ